ncbi:hypothetical protein KCTC52924_01603 [Arenibacter antarcticus]|uniref:Uncharacterized protein n=1 Tax=Arenibacter antarcticus TaxID=2040469 RepID=A0ABW5VJ60_9FLAO|nr:hypothetical protein [Arenibacter sp. H213]MCM4166752.1 hypothetical protein [Arenibacter sp. H213]
MKKKTVQTISLLWACLYSMNALALGETNEIYSASNPKNEKSLYHNVVIVSRLISKDKDSIKIKKRNSFLLGKSLDSTVEIGHLSRLQQIAAIRKGNSVIFQKTKPLSTFSSNNIVLKGKEPALMEKWETRTFPLLDENLVKNQDFNVSFFNLKPEFTQEFIAANFSKNPKVDTLVAQAKRAIDAVKELGNFVDVITGKELLELPVGLSKKDSTSGNTIELSITKVVFTPQYAEFNAWAKMIIPVKGPKGEPSRELYFGAEGIKLSHDGALLGDMKLVLLGDQAITLNGDSWLLTLKGGVNLKTGAFGDQSYIEFDCSGLKSIGLEADLRISRNILLPITSGGNYKCGDKSEDKYFRDSDVVKNECYVGANFSVKGNGWNDLLVEVSLPQFEIRGLKGWGFNLKRTVLDLSDSRNADGIKFPKDYSEVLTRGQRNLWRGFYAKEISVMLPKGIENTESSNKRVQFGAQHLILDSHGVSGSFFAEDVLKVGEGSAGQWAFTIADVSLSLSRNALTGGTIGGDIAVPILEKPMDYKGYIQHDGYGLQVGLQSKYKTPVFLGEMHLERNSSVAIDVKDGTVYPSANLAGQLSMFGKINQKEGEEESAKPEFTENNAKGFSFPGITFEGLKLETEPGKKGISAKSFGFEGEMKLMNFPASVEKLELVTPSNQVGLSFDLKVNLDGEGSHATTSMVVMGKLEDDAKVQKWKFEQVKIDGLEINYEKGNIKLKGGLAVMEDDPTYGDGFSGELTLTLTAIDYSASGKAMFGNKDFRYWFVDVWSDKNEDKSSGKLLINSFVGGVSHKMRKVSGNSDGFSPSSAVYKPDSNTGLGVRAGIGISAQNKGAFSGRVYLDMEFNTHGGLNRIGFTGEGTFMGGDKNSFASNSKDNMGFLENTLKNVEKAIEKNEKQIKKFLDDGNYLEAAQKSIPKSDVAKQGSIGVYVGIEKDFVNQTFDGEFELYLDLEGIRGGGPNNLAGYAKMHTGPEDWYIYIGTPQKRISLVFSMDAFELEVGGYFMTGTKLPSQLDPHPQVVKILGSDMLNDNRQENQLEAAKGFAFGLNFIYRQNYNFAIFYASLEAGAGFDVMHAYYPDAKCLGRPGPIGNNGWYSMGQIYAYLYGEFGVEVNLLFIKGKFQVAEAGVAAMLRGQFPNPVYIQGYVGMYYNILGGLVSGRMRLKVEMGEECQLENTNNEIGVPMIADVSPTDNSDDVSVFTAPQAVFNYPAGQSFDVELDKGKRTFKLQLQKFHVTSEGKSLEGTLEWNDKNDAVTFMSAETLPSQKEVKLVVEVSFDEKIGGTFQTLVDNGKPVLEKKEVIFKTDKAPDYIPMENILYMYPVPDQQSFYPEEYKIGYVKLKSAQNYLFESGYEMRAEFADNNSGQAIRTKISYDRSKSTVFYDVPDMMLNASYTLNLVAFPPGTEINQEIKIVKEELFAEVDAGDTNWFDVGSKTQGKETVITAGSALVASKKANKVTLSNGAPKSILDYNFKTSKHKSFKNKVKDLKVTDNLLNYIYADVHSMSIEVANYEYLEKLEVVGGKYTNSIPLVYAQAVLTDSYFEKQIHPLLYKNYPLDGNIRVNRDEELLGVPPIRSFYVGNEYLANLEGNPNSAWVKNRIPFVYNLPFIYKSDLVHLRNSIINVYNKTNGDMEKYEAFKYLTENAFPPLPLGIYKAQLIYRTPGDLYQKGYEIKYKND